MTKTKKNIKDSNYLQEVREQYENYPYPPRDPQNEKKRFGYVHACSLDSINYYQFSGKRDFSKGFRTLIAGGGTGDSTIMLAEQLRGTDACIVHLDISQASINVAKDRAKARKLDNIKWVRGSILDVQKIFNEKFDYINCIGVLHHLESPEKGLFALTSILKDDGVMELMLYAKYGRAGIYEFQNFMKILNKNENNLQNKIENCKSVLKNLPTSNGLAAIQHLFTDIRTYGDVGIYDMLLHSHDVAYSVPDIYKFLASSNLYLDRFLVDIYHGSDKDIYNLESYIKDKNLIESISNLSIEEKQTAAELIHGKIIKHHFYANKTKKDLPSLDNLDNIPSLSMVLGSSAYKEIYNVLKEYPIGHEVVCKAHNVEVRFKKTLNAERIFQFMDGYKTIQEIFSNIQSSYSTNEQKPTIAELKKEFRDIFVILNSYDWIFLRDKFTPRTKTYDEIIQSFQKLES